MVETCLKDVTFGNVSRKFIWIHVQVYIIFLQCVCCVRMLSLWQLKVPHSGREFSTFFIALEGTSLFLNTEYLSWAHIIHRCHQYFDMQSDIFCISSLLFSISFVRRSHKKYYYDHVASCRKEQTHTRTWYFSRTYILLLFCLCMMCCCCCYCWLCNVCSFAIFFYLLLHTIIANDHIWRITKQNFVQYNNIAYDTVWKALLGHKTRIVQCCSCSCCFFFITFTSIKLFKMIERTENI